MGERSHDFYRRVDWFLVACLLVVLAFGVVFVASASTPERPRLGRHVLWIIIGLAALVITARMNYAVFVNYAYTIYVVCIIALVAVLFTRPVNYARSWFDLGLFKVQPSEFAKLGLVLCLAKYLSESESYRSLKGLAIPLGLTLLPAALILRQPDLGTAMVFFPVCFAMLYAAGARLKHLGLTAVMGLAGAMGMFLIMHDYQKRRILAWLNPEHYEAGEAFQLLQSLVALGSGGVLGKGIGRGTQNKLGLVPVKESDFIFSVIGEEAGFIGAATLLALFALIFVAGFGIAQRAREPSGRMVALGVVVLIATQAFINVGVAEALLPTTGVTLPLVSYGGSSMLTCCIAVGLLLSVGGHRQWVISQDDFEE